MGTAAFIERDLVTQGNWIGSQYEQASLYNILGDGYGNASWASVTQTDATFTFWPDSFDARFLQSLNIPGTRCVGTWYSPTTFAVDVRITDRRHHRLAFYMFDGDNSGRSQAIQILDADHGDGLLDIQFLSDFCASPAWLVWDCTGHVRIRVTRLTGPNCVMSGYFFWNDPAVYGCRYRVLP